MNNGLLKGICWGLVFTALIYFALGYIVVMTMLLAHGHVVLSTLMATPIVVLAFGTIYHLERKQ